MIYIMTKKETKMEPNISYHKDVNLINDPEIQSHSVDLLIML